MAGGLSRSWPSLRRGARLPPAAALLCVALVGGSACAPRAISLPVGAGTPFPEAAAVYERAVENCRSVRSFEATLALSGRAGSQSLRGNVDAGFGAPASARLEMRGPIGRPIFILAATPEGATLYLPRENRVLRHTDAAAIVEALVGLPLGADELRSIISGCGFGAAAPEAGRAYHGGWIAVETGSAVSYLREVQGQWQLTGASRAPLSVQYSDFSATGRPSTVRLQAADGTPADVTVRLSDVTINMPLHAEVFDVRVPPGAEPLSLEELRRAGPLGAP